MIGLERLTNVQQCVKQVIEDRVPGDLIEAGVWRGGATILMRAMLSIYDEAERVVWAADSFAGLPQPDPERYPSDEEDRHYEQAFLAVPLPEVKRYFERYGYLDERVHFLEGWFRDTLPTLADHKWSVIRIDGDMYESTWLALENLYPGLSDGGFVILDDYGTIPSSREAVNDFRASNGIAEDLRYIDWTGVYWRKGAP